MCFKLAILTSLSSWRRRPRQDKQTPILVGRKFAGEVLESSTSMRVVPGCRVSEEAVHVIGTDVALDRYE